MAKRATTALGKIVHIELPAHHQKDYLRLWTSRNDLEKARAFAKHIKKASPPGARQEQRRLLSIRGICDGADHFLCTGLQRAKELGIENSCRSLVRPRSNWSCTS